MVEVFKTDITDINTADKIVQQLQSVFLKAIINFDLEDCDNILRIEHSRISAKEVMDLLAKSGHSCIVLE
jgi:hypothetical protein